MIYFYFYIHLYLRLAFPGFVDLQTVSITLRILYRPEVKHIPEIFRVRELLRDFLSFFLHTSTLNALFLQRFNVDYDERVLPSIGNEVLKAIVVCAAWFFELLYLLS